MYYDGGLQQCDNKKINKNNIHVQLFLHSEIFGFKEKKIHVQLFVHSEIFGYKSFFWCKSSKISNTSFLPKRPRQTAQTQIRLLLKKQSDQGLPHFLF